MAQAGPVLQRLQPTAPGRAPGPLPRPVREKARAQNRWSTDRSALIDPETHLVFDGIKAGSLVRAQRTYHMWVVPGLETELARTGPAVVERTPLIVWPRAVNGYWLHWVLRAPAAGDGLFAGIDTRLVATTLRLADDAAARDTARAIVLASAQSAITDKTKCWCSGRSGIAKPSAWPPAVSARPSGGSGA